MFQKTQLTTPGSSSWVPYKRTQVQFLCQNIDPKVCRIPLELPQNVPRLFQKWNLKFEHPRAKFVKIILESFKLFS